MSLTVIEYAGEARLAVMADAQLSPGHAVPAARWPAVLDRLLLKVDREIARIAAQTDRAAPEIAYGIEARKDRAASIIADGIEARSRRRILEPDLSTGERIADTLRPPTTVAVSPPPVRKRQD